MRYCCPPLAQLQSISVAKVSFKLSLYEAMCPDFGSHTMWGLLVVALRPAPAPPLLSKIPSDGRTETPVPLPGMSLLGMHGRSEGDHEMCER